MKTTDIIGVLLIVGISLIFAPWVEEHIVTYLLILVVVVGLWYLMETRIMKKRE